MQEKSDLFNAIWKDPLHEEEIRLDIAGVSYYHADIVANSGYYANVSGGEFDKPDIGNCTSRQIDFEVLPIGEIPRQAKIELFLRLRLKDRVSEWLQQGEFFISTRKKNKITGSLSIHGFDAMLKACQIWLTPDYDYDDWPKTEEESVNDIAFRMGVEVDPRTVLINRYMVDYPVDENGDMTMMDVLEGIAVANAGNWVITNDGKLLLVRYGNAAADTNYLITENGETILIGGVRLLV